MKNVLYINDVAWIGGAERALIDLVTSLDRSRYSPTVICPGEGETVDVLRAAGVPTHVVQFYGLRSRNPLRFFETLVQLRRVAISSRAQLVHVNQQYMSNYGVLLARICRLPVVIHLRGVESDEFLDGPGRWLWRADRVICISEATRSRLAEYAIRRWGKSKAEALCRKMVLVYDGVKCPASLADTGILRSDFGIDPGARIVGIAGQVTPDKGLQEFLDAAQVVAGKFQDVHFVIVGEDPVRDRDLAEQLRRQVAEAGLADRFTFTGFRSDAASLFAEMHLSVLASWQEAFGRVVIESLHAGTPVIATRVGGVPEIIEDGVSGFLVPPRDPAALADAMRHALAMNTQERQAMLENGISTAARFGIDAHVSGVQAVYDELLGN